MTIETLSGRDIVCFSNDWDGDPLSKTHLMRVLAERNRILWINSIGYRAPKLNLQDVGRLNKKLRLAVRPIENPERNIHVFNPLAVPAYGSQLARGVNRLWLRRQVLGAMRRLDFQRPITWVFLPSADGVAGRLGEDMVVYHCVDEFTAFAGVPHTALAAMERRLMQRADLVIVSAQTLLETKRHFNPRTVLVRHGVDYDLFRRALQARTEVPDDLRDLPRPILGFFGLIAEDWIDLELLRQVAQHFSHGSLVLLGNVTMDVSALRDFPNVHLLGRKPYESLPGYCKGFDVALVPFLKSRLTANSNPLKVWQYLAAGLPVVSTPIPEVAALPHCRLAEDAASFIREIEQALQSPGPQAGISGAVQSETWRSRVDEIRQHVSSLSAPATARA